MDCMFTVSNNNLEDDIRYWLRNCEIRENFPLLNTLPHCRKFCYGELQNFKRRGGYQQLARRGVKTAAKLSLAAEL
jgi:hypothetical protein